MESVVGLNDFISKIFLASMLKRYINKDNELNHEKGITGCFAVEEDNTDKENFEVYETGHKEDLESINLGPTLKKENREYL